MRHPTIQGMGRAERSEQPRHVAGEAASGESSEVLEQIVQQGLNLCNWERALPEGTEAELTHWTRTLAARIDVQLKRGDAVPLEALTGLPEGPTRDWLASDLTVLSALYMRLAQVDQIRFAFGPVNRTQCPKFHVDHIALRLLCTYVGPGTEWLPERALRRAALAKPSTSPLADNAALLIDAAAVQRAQPGNVLMMKGERYGDGTPGLVHRSPEIEASGVTRLVLTLSVMPSP